jgi:hypothetical protein
MFNMHKGFSRVIGGIGVLLVISGIFFSTPAFSASCPLRVNQPYKSTTSPKIYLVTRNCTKQHISNFQIYFTYFSSLRSVRAASARILNQIPADIQPSLGVKVSPKNDPAQAAKPVPTQTQNEQVQVTDQVSVYLKAHPDVILRGDGLGATRGPDKPLGNYIPDLYQEITLRASRNETIGFFVRGNVSECEAVQFNGPTGVSIKLFSLPYVTTSKPSSPSLYFGKQFDPVIPDPKNEICPGNGGWIFVDLSVTQQIDPGIYKIPFKLSISGKTLILNLRVLPMIFSLSEQALPSYWIFDEWASVQQHFGGKWDAPGRAELYGQYLNSMRDHKMTALNSEMAPLPIITSNGKSQLDVKANGYLDLVVNNRPQNAMISIPWDRNRSVSDQRDYLSAAENTVIENRWGDRAFIYLTDEPSRDLLSHVAEEARLAKQIAPHIKIMVTTAADPVLVSSVDIFVVLIDQIEGQDLPTPETYKKLIADGKQVWLYFSCDSHACYDSRDTKWPDLMLDDPGVQVRTIGWLNDHFGTNGFLYYYANLAYYKGDPFIGQFDFGGNGDGNVFYPGRPGEFGLTSNQPLPSLRMKIFRESANDAEYLKMLRAQGNIPVELKTRLSSIVRSSSDWSVNFQDYQKLRDDIGEYLANRN